MTNSSYVDGVLKKFIARHEGQYLDHSHAYGPQSPDLIEYYLTDLLGRPWQFRAGLAAGLWDDLHGTMKDFERVERGPQTQVSVDFRPGDVLVFGAALEGPGTVGIYVRPGSRVGSVQMFTQNPGPAKIIDIMADGALNKLLGGWRLTYAAECKIVVTKYAAELCGLTTTCDGSATCRALDHIEGCFATAPKHRVVETTTPAEPTGGHPLKTLYIDNSRGHSKTEFLRRWTARFKGK